MTKQIEINSVSLQYSTQARSLTVLKDVSLSVEKGELVVLLGPSGCGKSTILNLLAGFIQPDQGEILYRGEPVRKPGPERGMIFQQPNLFPWLTVLDNVTFGLRLTRYNSQQVKQKAEEWLDKVGLNGFAQHYPWQLSGGMKQRVALARAWVAQPEVLLLDEPFGALDAQTRLMMQELLRDAWLDTETTLLFVTHDVDEAIFLADRVLIMSARPGEIVSDIRLPFGRQRDIETLAETEEYRRIRHQILHQVRTEVRKHLNPLNK
ncbi:ABC transporter ATP-binding protein [Tatumella citrea]|uniref:ABC transporter ATP-binding protein n=1 Tax=Tatumella citrea TaxID=53336 RepID=A0A1Y0LJC4_TATCI|nr:ABC transporter ATP-binding protein [Tatumella citrea]ARU93712.1 ABC transporter ATP-binding protein [Tatumella citrea]ARU97750.1 ABC transporter ATP-binding protein [Tatumella citrea]